MHVLSQKQKHIKTEVKGGSGGAKAERQYMNRGKKERTDKEDGVSQNKIRQTCKKEKNATKNIEE